MPRPTTRTTREKAKAQLRLTARLERRGVDASIRLCYKITSQAVKRFRQGKFEPSDVTKLIETLQPTLREAMVISHLTGLDYSVKTQPKSLSLGTVFDDAIAALLNRQKADVDALREAYDAESLRVLRTASDYAEKRLEETITDITQKGMHVSEGVKTLEDSFDKLGLTPRNSFSLEAIYRTQTQTAFGAGKWQADQRPHVRDYIWGYVYSTVGDDRVRPEHEELEGMTAPRNHWVWKKAWPPNGWACRCTTIRLFDPAPVWVPDRETIEDAVEDGFGFNAGIVLF